MSTNCDSIAAVFSRAPSIVPYGIPRLSSRPAELFDNFEESRRCVAFLRVTGKSQIGFVYSYLYKTILLYWISVAPADFTQSPRCAEIQAHRSSDGEGVSVRRSCLPFAL